MPNESWQLLDAMHEHSAAEWRPSRHEEHRRGVHRQHIPFREIERRDETHGRRDPRHPDDGRAGTDGRAPGTPRHAAPTHRTRDRSHEAR